LSYRGMEWCRLASTGYQLDISRPSRPPAACGTIRTLMDSSIAR
jgi:hypothetical protein